MLPTWCALHGQHGQLGIPKREQEFGVALGKLGRYRLIRKLAQGGMAEVFLARSYGAHGFEKPVAIKRILGRYATDKQFVTMLIDEARINSGLSHPNVVPVMDFRVDDRDCYLVMEYVAGRSLAALHKQLATQQRQLGVEHLIHIVRETAAGLHHAHLKTDRQGKPLRIVHRDVSPQNILLGFDGYVKVIDFGIARARNRVARTDAGTLKGKLRYLAPEQVNGAELDGRTDLFALAITTWEALTGRALFFGDSDIQIIEQVVAAQVPDPRELNPDVPEELAASVLKALQREPEHRHSGCDVFAAELRGILARLNPDYDPATLGALVRTQFRLDMEQDAREEAAAEAELAAMGPDVDGDEPTSDGLALPDTAPLAPVRRPVQHAVTPVAPDEVTGDSHPTFTEPAPATRSATAPLPAEVAAEKVLPQGPVQERRERAEKGKRASEARRAAMDGAASSPWDAGELEPETNVALEKTLTGVPPGPDPTAAAAPELDVTQDGATATAHAPPDGVHEEATRPATGRMMLTATAKPEDPHAAPFWPRLPELLRQGSLASLAMMSAVVGALAALVLGLVVVKKLEATPLKAAGAGPGAVMAAGDGGARALAAADAPVTPVKTNVTQLVLMVSPRHAKVVVDGRAQPDWQKGVRLGAGSHRVQVNAEGFETQTRVVALAAGESREVEMVLGRAVKSSAAGSRKESPPARRVERAAATSGERRDGPPHTEERAETPQHPEGRSQIRVVTPGGVANIMVDGKRLKEMTPTIVEVTPGQHTVTLLRDDKEVKSWQVTVEAGASRTVREELAGN